MEKGVEEHHRVVHRHLTLSVIIDSTLVYYSVPLVNLQPPTPRSAEGCECGLRSGKRSSKNLTGCGMSMSDGILLLVCFQSLRTGFSCGVSYPAAMMDPPHRSKLKLAM